MCAQLDCRQVQQDHANEVHAGRRPNQEVCVVGVGGGATGSEAHSRAWGGGGECWLAVLTLLCVLCVLTEAPPRPGVQGPQAAYAHTGREGRGEASTQWEDAG